MTRRPLLYIFDADGTLRRTTVPGQPCPHAAGEWELLPGVQRALSRIPWHRNGPWLAVASNQDHVGYGLLSAEAAERLLRELLAVAVGPLAQAPGLAFCPHPPQARCACRKPNPGMLKQLMDYYGVAPWQALFVGDSWVDWEAALRAGVPFRWAGTFLHDEGKT